MATFKKGGTSRGAGAAKKGFDYAIYKKGGKVKKYEEGGGVETRSYASFGDWMGDLFGKKKVPASAMDETTTRAIRETERARPAADEDREIRRPAPTSESLPTAPRPRSRPSAQQRRMAARRQTDYDTMARDVAEGGGPMDLRGREERTRESQARGVGDDPILAAEAAARARQAAMGIGDDPTLARERRARARQAAMGIYAKGGVVKKAQGGSCRGMGAATRGGKYTIK